MLVYCECLTCRSYRRLDGVAFVCEQYRDPQTYFALVIGNNAYNTLDSLAKCVPDAEAMAKMLLDSGYPASNVRIVRNGSHDDIVTQLAWLREQVKDAIGCHVVFFYAGHGVEGVGGEAILLPVDAALSSA